MAHLSNSLHIESHREAHEAGKIKLLPFTIAVLFIQHHYIESWLTNGECTGKKPMKVEN